MMENSKGDVSFDSTSVVMSWKDWLDGVAPVIEALSNFVWPIIFIVLFLLLRKQLKEFISVAINKIKAATEIEFGGIKIRGERITGHEDVLRTEDGLGPKIVRAEKSDLNARAMFYSDPRNLMPVHTVRPAQPEKYENGLRVFDISIYITAHRNRGNINDIKQVTYYFGDKWGKHKYGSKYVVDSANDCFALTTQMWGACICLITIEFHDQSKPFETQRYLDVEMAPVYGIPLKDAREGTP